MLDAYYDCANAGAPVVNLAGGNTELAHSFAILRFDLSGVADAARAASPVATTSHDMVVTFCNALDAAVLRAVDDFKKRYAIPAAATPNEHVGCLVDVCEWATKRGTPVYVLVDECDAPLRHTMAIYKGTIEEARHALVAMHGFYDRFMILVDIGLVSRIFLTGTFAACAFTCIATLHHHRCPNRMCRHHAAGGIGRVH